MLPIKRPASHESSSALSGTVGGLPPLGIPPRGQGPGPADAIPGGDAPEIIEDGALPDEDATAGGGDVVAVRRGPVGATRRLLAHILPAPLWRIGKLLVIALVIEYLVLPQLAGTRKAWHQLTKVDPVYLLAGAVLEIAALACYAQLTRSVLDPKQAPPLWTVWRIQLTTLSVSHCVPAGTAAGSGLGYRLMTNVGVEGSEAGFALATQALGSALVLNVILWVALVVSIPVWGFSPLYLTAAIVGSVLIAVFVALVLLLTRGEEWATAKIVHAASRVPFIDGAVLGAMFARVALRLQGLLTHRKRLGRAVIWAALNWLLDAASLYVFVGAFGHWVNPDGLLVAYALANVFAAIPITPGGLGVIEATLTSTLVGFDTPRAIAILGVLSYRLVNFWLPIPIGGVAYLSLQVGPHGRRPAVAARAPSESVGG